MSTLPGCTCMGGPLCPQCHALLARTGAGPVVPHEPERAFQARLRRAALDLGWLYYHTYDSRGSDADFPDTLLTKPGRVLIWELKVGRNKPTQGQRNWLSVLATVPGVETGCYWPRDWETMLAILTRR